MTCGSCGWWLVWSARFREWRLREIWCCTAKSRLGGRNIHFRDDPPALPFVRSSAQRRLSRAQEDGGMLTCCAVWNLAEWSPSRWRCRCVRVHAENCIVHEQTQTRNFDIQRLIVQCATNTIHWHSSLQGTRCRLQTGRELSWSIRCSRFFVDGRGAQGTTGRQTWPPSRPCRSRNFRPSPRWTERAPKTIYGVHSRIHLVIYTYIAESAVVYNSKLKQHSTTLCRLGTRVLHRTESSQYPLQAWHQRDSWKMRIIGFYFYTIGAETGTTWARQ